MECYTALRRNELLMHAKIYIDLGNIVMPGKFKSPKITRHLLSNINSNIKLEGILNQESK